MSEEFKTNEECECNDNQEVRRQAIEIAVSDDNTLTITNLLGPVRHSEEVASGGTSTFTGRSYEDLFDLGAGRHRLCKCETIGPPGTIHRTKRD